MSNAPKKYISNVKALFPVIGRNERKYIKTLSANIEDYCCEHNVESVEELYEDYASPADVVRDYYAVVDMEDTIKKIRLSKLLKATIITLIIAVCISLSILISIMFSFHKSLENEQTIVSNETSVNVSYNIQNSTSSENKD